MSHKIKSLSEKTTSNLRIFQIEKSIRSISSILDTRTTFPIEEVHINEKERNERKQKIRRENVSQTAIAHQGHNAIEMLKERGIVVSEVPDEFADEERIWRSKSKAPTYTQKRRFEEPELHNFFLSLNELQLKEFHILTREALYELSTKTRESMKSVKESLDGRGIFHPQANAHRVHCSYLMKLYKL
jgi:hypothetical protein